MKQTETFFYPYPMVFLHEVLAQLQMVLQSPSEVHRIPLLYRAQPVPSSAKLLQHPHLHVQAQSRKEVQSTKKNTKDTEGLPCEKVPSFLLDSPPPPD